jgi:hypothetical protein
MFIVHPILHLSNTARIEHVNNRVKGCCIVHDTLRLSKKGTPRSGDGNLLGAA